ncbi:ornithine decarboxylase [Iris pallida]|uniref:ornithine decarboxylase n=1 Tax=Iris pallida TaxID=29817 RepID=A0AAX6DLP9_IRIPA|nr:ornithine decarboxylase [Iris pallida]KAJ6839317.1 ornithine decarboxylase [Iris pallida]
MSETSTDIERVLSAPGVKENKKFQLLPEEEGVAGLIQSIIDTGGRHKEDDDPFYVLNLTTIDELFAKWTRSLRGIRPFYAVKCNRNRSLLEAMASLGAGFDCGSRAEIESALSLGVPPEDIIYANPCKAESHIKYAASVGVNLTTVDSVDEIDKIKRRHPECRLVIRIKPPVDANAKWDLGLKYGALPGEVVPLLEAAKSAGLAVVGVSFHVGSEPTRMEAYRGAIAGAKAAFDAAEGLGMAKMTMLDIGGGFMARRQFDEAAEIIGSALTEHFADRPELTVIAEPGRFFAETPFTLATNIIGRRVRGELREYWINDGLFGSLNHKAYDKSTVFTATPLALSSDRQNPTCEGKETYVSTVFGPTLDSIDTVLTEHRLPELRAGDWLVFPNMGAYCASAATSFNGLASSDVCTYLAYAHSHSPVHAAENENGAK